MLYSESQSTTETPLLRSKQITPTDLDGTAPSVFSTSEASSEFVPYDDDQRAQLFATGHRRSSAGRAKRDRTCPCATCLIAHLQRDVRGACAEGQKEEL